MNAGTDNEPADPKPAVDRKDEPPAEITADEKKRQEKHAAIAGSHHTAGGPVPPEPKK